LNGDWALARARALAKSLLSKGTAPEEVVRAAYRQVLGHDPSPTALRDAVQFLERQAADVKPRRPQLDNFARRKGVQLGKANELLRLDNAKTLPDADFTIEAFVQLRSMYESAEVRTIVSQWSADTRQPGWSLGITSKKSAYKPLNLILQMTGDASKGGQPYEVVASNLHLEVGKPYYVAASVRIADTTANGITFYAKSLEGDQPLRTARVAHRVDGHYRGRYPLILGGRAGTKRHRWDGLVGELRLTASALKQDELLIREQKRVPPGVVGWWKFSDPMTAGRDSSPRGNDLALAGSNDPLVVALTDLCHVLMNSNEFLFCD